MIDKNIFINGNKVYNSYLDLEIVDGLLIGRYLCPYLTLSISELCLEARIHLSKGEKYPLLSDCRNVLKADAEVRHLLSGKEAAQDIIAGALLINSPSQRVMNNLFIHFHNPPVPTKLFTDEQKAIAWLTSFTD